jgi:hypothetical protein
LINISCGLYAFKLLKTPAVCNVFSKTGTLHSTAGQGSARGFFTILRKNERYRPAMKRMGSVIIFNSGLGCLFGREYI